MHVLTTAAAGATALRVAASARRDSVAHLAQAWLDEHDRPLCIRSVAAVYGEHADVSGWKAEPHHQAHHTSDVLEVARSFAGPPARDLVSSSSRLPERE